MILKMFAVYDDKAKAHLTPFFLPETAQAVREFSNCINMENHAWARNPEDYSLWELGQFENTHATLETYAKPEPLGIGIGFVQTELEN